MRPVPSVSRHAQAECGGSITWHSVAEGIHWCRVDLDDPSLLRRSQVLQEAEEMRAARFRFATDRNRYVAAQVALRAVLTDVTGEANLCFERGAFGKPQLAPDTGWTFNLSHSGGIGVIAIARSDVVASVGVDVELARPIGDWRGVAEVCFSNEECQALGAASERDRTRDFLRIWTRKEACVKAIGIGLAMPTTGFTTGFDAAPRLVRLDAAGGVEVEVLTLFEDIGGSAAIAWCVRAGEMTQRAPVALAPREASGGSTTVAQD